MAQSSEHFRISPKLQEIICLLGQGYVFDEAAEILEQTLKLNISAKQVQLVSEYYGGVLEKQQQEYIEQENAPVLTLKTQETPVYMMPDGSMVFTREHGWKEVKVGRVFSLNDRIAVQPSRNEIKQSMYLCHIGTHEDFFKKWEAYIQGYKNKIFIADGAVWIWNWVCANFPEAIQILDFYHAVEKLAYFATYQYVDESKRKQWMDEKKQQLRNNEVQEIIEELRCTIGISQEAEKTKGDVIRYYQNNSVRMQYKTYLEKGYLIGSGAIEAAHRNVVQQRLKLSGQRWSIKGAQQIVNLRAYRKSDLWGQVVSLIKNAA